MDFGLKGKHALVTGGSKGIGKARITRSQQARQAGSVLTALTSPRSIARSAVEERWTRPCTLMP